MNTGTDAIRFNRAERETDAMILRRVEGEERHRQYDHAITGSSFGEVIAVKAHRHIDAKKKSTFRLVPVNWHPANRKTLGELH